MKNTILIILLALLPIFAQEAKAQDIPQRPNPPRLMNDMAEVLTVNERQSLEADLEDYARQTSTQIAIVTVSSLNGNDISDFAFRLGEQWGVGQKGKDNGITIVYKPKTSSEKGQVFIAVGYGLEGVIPDAIAKRIVSKEMIPYFREGDTYGGFVQAVSVLKSLALKEYSAKEYEERTAASPYSGLIISLFLFFWFFIFFVALRSKRSSYTTGRGAGCLTLGLLAGASGNRSGSWNNFSSGGGSFGGGSSGGFGGFGGGSFGGGGAGGSW